MRPRASNEIGHSHLSFYVDDLDATLADLRAQGVEMVEGSRAELGTGMEVCVIRDPDGFPIELVEAPGMPLAPYRSGD